MDTPKPDENKPGAPVTPPAQMTPDVPPVTVVAPPVNLPVTPESPVMPAAPAPAVPLDQTAGVKTKSNNMIYILIAVLIAILLGLAGLFFYRQFSSATNQQAEINVPTPVAATPTIVVPTYSSPEEKDVMGIDVGGVDSQLKIIEDDVKKL